MYIGLPQAFAYSDFTAMEKNIIPQIQIDSYAKQIFGPNLLTAIVTDQGIIAGLLLFFTYSSRPVMDKLDLLFNSRITLDFNIRLVSCSTVRIAKKNERIPSRGK